MFAFKTHLKKLKIQLFEFNQKHKIMIFLTKLKQNLKFKILNIDNVSRSRKNILTLTIMQKKTMKCNQRKKNIIDVNHYNKSNKNFKNNFKFEKNKLNNKFDYYNDDATTRDDDKFNDFRDNSKSFKKLKNEIDNRKFNYFIYEKSKHWKNQCSNNLNKSKQSTSRVNAIDIKKKKSFVVVVKRARI